MRCQAFKYISFFLRKTGDMVTQDCGMLEPDVAPVPGVDKETVRPMFIVQNVSNVRDYDWTQNALSIKEAIKESDIAEGRLFLHNAFILEFGT